MNNKQPIDQAAQGDLVQYRVEGVWCDRAIPDLTRCTLHLQEEHGKTEITCFVNKEDMDDAISEGADDLTSSVLRYAHWQAWWAAWTEPRIDSPWMEEWVQDLAVQVPGLSRLSAQLFTVYFLTTHAFPTEIRILGRVITIELPHFLYSMNPHGVRTVGISLDDPAFTPLVDYLEVLLDTIGDGDFCYLCLQALGPRLWVDCAVGITLDMEADLGQESLAAMSDAQFATAFLAYISDAVRYSEEIIPLISGYVHQFVREEMMWTVDIQVLQNPAYDDTSRQAAAERVLAQLGLGIAPQLWTQLKPVLTHYAAQHNRTLQEETQSHMLSALVGALGKADRDGPVEFPLTIWGLPTRLYAELRTSLLGPHSWRQQRQCSLDRARDAMAVNLQAQVETRLIVEQLVERARLSKREEELVNAQLQGETSTAAAQRLGITPSAARTLLARARKKILQSM